MLKTFAVATSIRLCWGRRGLWGGEFWMRRRGIGRSNDRSHAPVIVPTLRVGMQPRTLRVRS